MLVYRKHFFCVYLYSIYMYTIFMKKSTYPDWVEKYRTCGRTIRKISSGYGLYKCTSVYVKGQKYPKSVQEYLGRITEKDGFIPKKVISSDQPEYLEYGLSHVIYMNFRRDLQRLLFNSSGETAESRIRLMIIHWVFSDIYPASVRSSYLAKDSPYSLLDYASGFSDKWLVKGDKKINDLLHKRIPDDIDRSAIINGLRLCVADKKTGKFFIPRELKELLRKYELRYE